MIVTAQNALLDNPTMKKVVILEHLPRFDAADVDPLGLKPIFANIANHTFHQLWLNSPLKDKIFLGSHRLDISEKTKDVMLRSSKNGRLDRVHYYGNAGQEALTENIQEILNEALPPVKNSNDNLQDSHLTCPQAIFQTRNSSRKSYAKAASSKPAVSTRNRFSTLADMLGN